MKFLHREHLVAPASAILGSILSHVAFALTLILGTPASAQVNAADASGAIANIEACVYAREAPVQPITYTFSVGVPVNRCMLKSGKGNTLVVEKVGLFCASLGEVESKTFSSNNDNCLTDSSKWSISYSAPGAEIEKGSIGSDWSHPIIGDDSIELENQNPRARYDAQKTTICQFRQSCMTTEQDWSPPRYDVPTYYIVFQQ